MNSADDSAQDDEKKCIQHANLINDQHQATQTIDSTHALIIPIAASFSLLLMFFFFESIQTAFLLCTSVLAIVTFAFLFLPICTMIFKYFCRNSEIYR